MFSGLQPYMFSGLKLRDSNWIQGSGPGLLPSNYYKHRCHSGCNRNYNWIGIPLANNRLGSVHFIRLSLLLNIRATNSSLPDYSDSEPYH